MSPLRLRSGILAALFACQALAGIACRPGRAAVRVDPGAFYVTTVYSPNERYYLRGAACGRTPVYERGRGDALYVVGDAVDPSWGQAYLSNDGRVIVYVDGRQPSDGVSIYRDGRLVTRLTASELTRCDPRREDCQLLYSNSDEVIDRERSVSTSGDYRRVFKAGVSEKEQFLNRFPLFSSGDTVYVIDSRKRVHRFSLVDGTVSEAVAFDVVYPDIRQLPLKPKTEEAMYPAPDYSPSSLVVAGGRRADEVLARRLHLKVMGPVVTREFRNHMFFVSGALRRDGRFEVDELTTYGDFKKEDLTAFFASTRFDARLVPAPCDWWYLENQAFSFRHPDKDVARKEQRTYLVEQEKERQQRVVAERIDGVYIPKDLGECFVALDGMLAERSRDEMKALSTSWEMGRYHMGLGMGLRNTWGLWGGSRLQRYLQDRGVRHPDEMSGIILDYYYDWLQGDREGWKNWQSGWRARAPQAPPPPPPPPVSPKKAAAPQK